MSQRVLKGRKSFVISIVLLLLGVAVLTVFDFPLLCVSSRLRPADAVVVLGGEPVMRVRTAANLVSNGFAPRVIISGSGDCEHNGRLIEQLGVPATHVELECDSATTKQNAEFSIKRLRERGCRRVLIVTSWYHSRRALSTFRRYAPEIEFLSIPAPRTQAWRYERGYIMAEYAKTIWYAVRYGIWPATAN